MVDFATLIHGWIPVGGGQVSYFHTHALGKPLVLLPGSFSDARQFESLLAHLPGTQPVIIIENRGHGGSWPPVKHGSIELFARDVVQVLDALAVDKFFVGGHSIGGMIAIEVGRVCPGRVLGIISIEGWTNHKAARAAYGGLSNYTGLTPDQDLFRQAERGRVLERWNAKQIKHFGGIWKKWDGKAFLVGSSVPIIEIYGDRGKTPPTHEALDIPQKSNIDLIVLAGGSHSLPLQFPDKLASIVRDFIGRA